MKTGPLAQRRKERRPPVNITPGSAPRKDFPGTRPSGCPARADHEQAPRLEGPVGPHIRKEFTRLRGAQTVGEALDWLRANPPGDRILYFYVLDGDGRLEGIVPTRRLVLARTDQKVSDLMVREVVALPEQATVLEACEFFIQYRFLALPVVDAQRRMLGVVDVELYTDELGNLGNAQRRDELFQQIGVHVAGAEQQSPVGAFRRRFPWLSCNLAGGILAAFLSGLFEQTLKDAVSLALFIPVVLNLAESVSSQSVSLTLHLLQGQRPTWKSAPRQLLGETATGLLLGAGCGLVVGLVALLWLRQVRVALALLGGIAGGVTLSAVLGLMVPVVLRLLRLDPRVAAGPIVLAGADILTILLYLNLASWLLH
jgi:magnesium transporter